MEQENLKITFDGLKVTYENKVGDQEIELEGTLWPYNDGRDARYRFSDDWFAGEESKAYFDENWEDIEDQILELYNIVNP